MQKNIFIFSLVLCSLFTLNACEKDENMAPVDDSLNEEEITQLLSTSMTSDTEGLMVDMATMQTLGESLEDLSCGENRDSIVSRNIDENYLMASYGSTYNWSLNCNEEVPSSIHFSRTLNGQYSTNRFSGADSGQGDWLMTGLDAGLNYIFNGSYGRTGTLSTEGGRGLDTQIDFTLTDVLIGKATHLIKGGSGSVTLSVTSAIGNTYTSTGSIEFNGDGTVTIIINGQTYIIELF